jgi:hypothetical protein
MERIKTLPTGAKLVLASGPLLFLNLSFTWQRLEVDFGPAGKGERLLDGWDLPGLLVGLLTLALVTLVGVLALTEAELPPTVPWERVVPVLGCLVLALTAMKHLTDEGSTLASYVGVAFAATLAAGALLEWNRTRAPSAGPLSRGA